ncbi:binding partner of ACD11 1 isoform X2 [Punica granatum]|uniref:Binding partner of ACD11 1 isoform X2 n=1 Tax=Punica granatum TaxID=22663 RepID=A0A6P8CPM7_PUNGR|nr:binding partner of ACD11 1 isoform X2 [Punica granatum]
MAHSTRFGFQVSTRLTVTVESGRLKLPVTFPGREENRNFPFASPFHWNRSRERSRDSLEKFQSSESCPNSTPLSQSPPESSSSEPNSNRSSRVRMSSSGGGYAVEVTSLSPKATESDLYDFFAFSGAIEHLEIVRSGDYGSTAYVTFKDAYSQETAVLLSGATIVDQQVCITRWGHYDDELDFWNRAYSLRQEDDTSSSTQGGQFVSNPGEAVAVAQEVVKTMLAKGYTLSKDALAKAKDFDESHQVSATALNKVSDFAERTGLADKLFAGVEAVKSVDEKYHVTELTRSAVSATGRSAAAAANSVMNSSYFSKGALWFSGALNRAAQVAADLGSQGAQQRG